MTLFEDDTLEGAIRKATAGLGRQRKQEQMQQDSDSGIWLSPFDRHIRELARRPSGPDAADESAWEIIPGFEGGATFETGRYLRLTANQINDPRGGSRNPVGLALGLLPSGGHASLSVSVTKVNGGGRLIRVELPAPYVGNRYHVEDLGPNEAGRDKHQVMLTRGHSDVLIKAWREKHYEQIGIARYVDTVNFVNP